MNSMIYKQPATQTVAEPKKLTDLRFPELAISTRTYFTNKPTEQKVIVPMHVGLEGVDGKIYSIWELEELKRQGQFIELKNFFDERVNDSPNPDGVKYTFKNDKSAYGIVGTHGNRNLVGIVQANGTREEKHYSLRWEMTEVQNAKQTEEMVICPHTGVLSLKGIILSGTALETYAHNIKISPILSILDSILYDGKKWYLLPNHEPMTDPKFLASLKGLRILNGVFDPVSDRKFNAEVEQAFLAWLASKVFRAENPLFRSSYLIKDEGIIHKGGGIIERQSPRHKPSRTAPRKPAQYDDLIKIAQERAPLEFIMNIIMVKGFEIKSTWAKRSLTFGVAPSNYAKTQWLYAALRKLNLATKLSFSAFADTITSGDKVGSVELHTKYKYGLLVFDEAKAMAGMKSEQVGEALKLMADGEISGAAKGLNSLAIILPPSLFLAAEEMEGEIQRVASDDELENRTNFPVFGKNTAAVDFKGYSESDALDALVYFFWSMFYEKYDQLLELDESQREKWATGIELDEGGFDRVKVREKAQTYHLDVLTNLIATFIEPNTESKLVSADKSLFDKQEEVSIRRDIALDRDYNLLINSPFTLNRGIYLYMNEELHESSNGAFKLMKKARERDRFRCIAAQHRTSCYMGAASIKAGKSYVSNTFRIPLCKFTLRKTMVEIEKSIGDEELKKAFKDKEIVPFLKKISLNSKPNPVMNSIVGRLVQAWSIPTLQTNNNEEKTDEGEKYVSF